ncbi:FmdB family zinc ribbon protein [Aureimonas endophytica]|uniref:FmdB family zinc ribbon protein n=1 Tax=Aureimonas endophytica TaxID=2027858 RepID=UPI00166E6434|nr:zinc ribbon domain-containing protein [Aureimonas endophytica]
MPNYDYACPTCGPFTAMRPMAEFHEPCACPTCGGMVPRAILSAPAIAGLNPIQRSAFAASEARTNSRESVKAAHPAGCGCCMRGSPIPSALASTDRVFSSSGPLPRERR